MTLNWGMPGQSGKPKLPGDLNQLAAGVVGDATDESAQRDKTGILEKYSHAAARPGSRRSGAGRWPGRR